MFVKSLSYEYCSNFISVIFATYLNDWQFEHISIPQDFIDDKSTLVQVMAWCPQPTSHYLKQWWPRSQAPYGTARPQWVNSPNTSIVSMHIVTGSSSVQKWGLLKLCSLIPPWAKFSTQQKYMLDSLNHIHIWQVSPQLSCSDTSQI